MCLRLLISCCHTISSHFTVQTDFDIESAGLLELRVKLREKTEELKVKDTQLQNSEAEMQKWMSKLKISEDDKKKAQVECAKLKITLKNLQRLHSAEGMPAELRRIAEKLIRLAKTTETLHFGT